MAEDLSGDGLPNPKQNPVFPPFLTLTPSNPKSGPEVALSQWVWLEVTCTHLQLSALTLNP